MRNTFNSVFLLVIFLIKIYLSSIIVTHTIGSKTREIRNATLILDIPNTNFIHLQDNFRCPVPRDGGRMGYGFEPNTSNGKYSNLSPQIIKLNEMNGRKVKIQFFYPKPNNSSRQLVRNDGSGANDLSSSEVTTLSGTETTSVGITDHFADIEITSQNSILDKMNESNVVNAGILCQWQFLAGNSTQYLLLTFSKMSAPYSDNCYEAYVSMKKDDGYESRWCHNRRQGNGRPLALFSREYATVTVFRRRSAPQSPPTGFSVTVESLENRAVNRVKDSLRILRKI